MVAGKFVDLPEEAQFDAKQYFGVAVSFQFQRDFAVKAPDFIAAFKAEVDSEMSIRDVRPRNAFARTVREMEAGRLVDRVHETEGLMEFQFTQEFYDATIRMKNYNPELRVSFDKTTEKISVAASNVDPAVSADIVRRLENIYREKSNYFFGDHLHTIFKRWLTKHCGLIGTGPRGLYFVPASKYGAIIKLDGFIRKYVGRPGTLFVLPVAKTERTREDIKFAFEEEAIGEIEKLRDELKEITENGGDVTERMSNTRLKKIQIGLQRVAMYEDVLGMQLSSIRTALEDFKSEVRTVVSAA